MANEHNSLTLEIVTFKGAKEPIACDSIHLTVQDDLQQKGGGSYGIRPGHAKALIALDEGPLAAYRQGQMILRARVGTGFATVHNDTVTVVTEDFDIQ